MEIEKRKPGRPVVAKHATALNEEQARLYAPSIDEVKYTREPKVEKVGHFITVNTPHRKGIRVDLNDISEYAKAGQEANDVQIVFKNGRASIYRFGSEEDAYKFLGLLDEHCL